MRDMTMMSTGEWMVMGGGGSGKTYNDTVLAGGACSANSDCFNECKSFNYEILQCVFYLASDCTSQCCQSDFAQVPDSYSDTSSYCDQPGIDFWTDWTLNKLDMFGRQLQFCYMQHLDPSRAQVLGDPHIHGFDGTPFLFDGEEGAVFALISERDHQVNALFGSVGPKHGVDSTIWMLGFGVRVRDELALAVHIDADPEDIALFRDERARHGTKMRVRMPEREFLHIELNGRHADGLLYSGRALRPSKGALVYFPPATAVNPNDATDGELAQSC